MTEADQTPPIQTPDPLLGRLLAGRYRVVALIARGGMARLYRARDERLERDVALKVLSDPYARDPEFVERFLGEARTAASLTHPSLVHVYDSGSDDDEHFMVMELLERHRSLAQVLADDGPLSAAEAVSMGRELLAGLRVVHERGLVHCDVKAGNVMVGPGPAKLIDFGIARRPRESRDAYGLGSLPYMSPEQLRGEPLTPASDLFSLGVVLYEALTGTLPFAGETPAAIIAAQEGGEARPPSAQVDRVPRRMDQAIAQALRPQAESRFRSAEAMDRALEASLGGTDADETEIIPAASAAAPPTAVSTASAPDAGYVPPVAPAPPPAPLQRRPGTAARRRSGLWRAAGTAILLVAAGLVLLLLVAPLLQLGGSPGASGAPTATASVPTAAPATVEVPNTIGLSTADAIAAATAAGLNWTVRCNQDPRQPEGIIDQEPPAGTPVQAGARFTMYSARIQDCR